MARSLPSSLRVIDAEAAYEAAATTWTLRARAAEARPESTDAARLARWAAEDLRDARVELEAARAEVAR